jgi:large subunit ribosomal protein L9
MSKEVVLMEDVPGLGDQGEVVRVSDGYARNFLLPRKLAAPVTDATLKMIERKRKEYEARKGALREESEKQAQLLTATPLTIRVKVGSEGRLFGSVTALDLVDAAKLAGIVLDKKQLQLDEPLRALGDHKVPVKLAADVQGMLKVTLVEE